MSPNVMKHPARPNALGPLRVHAPRVMPTLAMMIDDVGSPTDAHLAAFLGTHARTVARWRTQGHAPRPVALALFWLTRWGRSQIDCQAVNDARLAYALAAAETARSARLAAALGDGAGGGSVAALRRA